MELLSLFNFFEDGIAKYNKDVVLLSVR